MLCASTASGDTEQPTQERAEQAACLRCHAMTTLAYRNPADGRLVDLVIDRGALGHSIHGELACTDCHRRSYTRYPHPDRPRPGDLDCIGCHRDDDADLGRQWLDMEAEFKRSVHARSDAPAAADFSCHSCHDPHRFRPAAIGEPIGEIVQRHNGVCLSCHTGLTDPMAGSHAWLPNRDAHWTAVRCIDCHTPGGPTANHEILAAESSARNCVGCHSADAQLLARLYHFRSDEEIASRGLLAKAVLNESYVVGMSKSPELDRLSLILMGLLALLLTAHGFGRYRAHRARRRSP
jgi:hypothetical protein